MKSLLSSLIFVLALSACNGGGGGGNGGATGGGSCGILNSDGTTSSCPTNGGTTEQPQEGFSFESINPEDGSININVDNSIYLSFTQPIYEGSLIYNSGDKNLDNVSLVDEQGNDILIDVSTDNGQLIIDPVYSLDPAKQYTVSIRSTLQDTAYNSLTTDISSKFITANEQGSNPTYPVLTFTDHDNEAQNVQVDKYELHYGSYSREGMGADFKYERMRNVTRYEANQNYNPELGNYTVKVEEPFTTGLVYYFTLNACNSGGCSKFSNETWRYIE